MAASSLNLVEMLIHYPNIIIISHTRQYEYANTCWHDYQVLINNLDRTIKMLKFVPADEPAQHRNSRLWIRRPYKKALRIHTEHIRLGVQALVQQAEDELEAASLKEGVTKTELQGLRDQVSFLKDHQDGLVPTNPNAIANIAEAGQEGRYYAQLSSAEQVDFWNLRWDDDVFVSFLWEFQGVLHFQTNWDDAVIRGMYHDKFLWLAGLVVENILVPRQVTAACASASTSPLIRGSIRIPEDRTTAYAEFKRADQYFWPTGTPNAPGDQSTLWVQDSPNQTMRTRKRTREEAEVAGPVGGGYMAAIMARNR